MTGGPDQPFRGVEYPSLENTPRPVDPYAPVDYPANAGLPPPVYPTAYSAPPGYPPAGGYPAPGGYPGYGGSGYQPDPYDPYRPSRPPGTNGLAIAALVTALVGLLFCGLPSIVGVILGVMAMRETRRTGQDGRGIALAGVIIGGLTGVLWLLYFLIMIAVAVSGFQYAP